MLYSILNIGQSNERGQGQSPGCNLGRGTPVQDPTMPNGSNERSWFPSMARELGKRKIQVAVLNHAVGATSLSVNWVGLLTPWISGMSIRNALYVISDGAIWKCGHPFGAAIIVSTAQPTGSSNITGSDGIPWAYIRQATGSDVRHVCMPDDPLFDPSGWFSSISEALLKANGKKICMLSIGQTDANLINFGMTTVDDFRDAYISTTKFILSQNIDEIYLGFTCYSALYVEHYPALVSAIEEALLYFSGNPKVRRGANLWQAMGALPTNSDARLIALYDGLHMTDAAYEVAGQLWANCILTGGV